MEGFFGGLGDALDEQNWHAALVMALTLPDICGKADAPGGRSGQRYAAWFDRHVGSRYKHRIGAGREEVIFLSGNDCYALRCALLHEGSTDTSTHSAREALSRFHFCTPGQFNNGLHCIQINDALVLMVDEFARDVLDAARAWWASLTPGARQAAADRSIALHDTDNISI
ncbi:hypothetical protein [Streptomyces sp. G45]|uniref:hypothetical protein n=1 Tax=Streptomyces sp. G45 TaxID=3406627 RepID=UPI003C1BFA07